MPKRRIIARDYRGKALIRYVVQISEKSIQITDSEGILAVEFPRSDIFEYSQNINDGAADVDWGSMNPFQSI